MNTVVLHTARLVLRELNLDDAEFIVELVNDPDWLRFIGDKNVHDVEGARRYLREGPLASYSRNGFGLWCVELEVERAPIGMCGLIRRDTLPDVDVGFAFLARFRGAGYAREAAEATLAHGFGKLGLQRIVAITALDNVRSQRLLERIGMRFESRGRLAGDSDELAFYGLNAPRLDS